MSTITNRHLHQTVASGSETGTYLSPQRSELVAKRMRTVLINGHRFVLRPGTDTARIESALVSTIRDGSGFVAIPVAGRRTVRVLVTALTTVVFEDLDIAEETDTEAPESSEQTRLTASHFDEFDW